MVWDAIEIAAAIPLVLSFIRRVLLPLLVVCGVFVCLSGLVVSVLLWLFPANIQPSSKATMPVIRQSQSKPKYDDGNPANSYATQPTDE